MRSEGLIVYCPIVQGNASGLNLPGSGNSREERRGWSALPTLDSGIDWVARDQAKGLSVVGNNGTCGMEG